MIDLLLHPNGQFRVIVTAISPKRDRRFAESVTD